MTLRDIDVPAALTTLSASRSFSHLHNFRVALAHDYLTQRGGAERVVLALAEAFPDAPIYTSVYNPETTYDAFRSRTIHVSSLNRIPLFRRDPRLALPFLPAAWRNTVIEDVDVVICSSTGWAHGVTSSAAKLVYCHNPARWLYQADDYLQGGRSTVGAALRVLRPALLRWDQTAAASADRYLANSTSVRDRVVSTYGRQDVDVIHPPAGLDGTDSLEVPSVRPGYYLTVGRRRGYKNTDVVVDAFRRRPGQRLVVVGGVASGPLPENITVLSDVSDAHLHWLYANARSLVACAFEDFGLTPVEAYSVGTPALCLRAGGYLDSMVEGVTGEFIQTLSADAVLDTLDLFESRSYAREAIREHGRRFAKRRFIDEIDRSVQDVLVKRQHRDRHPSAARSRRLAVEGIPAAS